MKRFALLTLLLLWTAPVSAQSQCASFDVEQFQSVCGTISVPSVVHPGEQVTVNITFTCGSTVAVSLSYAESAVIVDGLPVTATAGTPTIYHPEPQPVESMRVSVSSPGAHTIVFKVRQNAPNACVRSVGSALSGPWAVLSGGNWSSPRPFLLTEFPAVTPGTILQNPPVVSVSGNTATIVMEKFSKASLKRAKTRALARARAAKKGGGGKLGFRYQVFYQRTSDANGGPVSDRQRSKLSKRNELTLKNLSPGNYQTNYLVQITKKDDGKTKVAGRTKPSPSAVFTIGQ